MATDEDKHLFDLLRRAYIEARYKKSYRISADELARLGGAGPKSCRTGGASLPGEDRELRIAPSPPMARCASGDQGAARSGRRRPTAPRVRPGELPRAILISSCVVSSVDSLTTTALTAVAAPFCRTACGLSLLNAVVPGCVCVVPHIRPARCPVGAIHAAVPRRLVVAPTAREDQQSEKSCKEYGGHLFHVFNPPLGAADKRGSRGLGSVAEIIAAQVVHLRASSSVTSAYSSSTRRQAPGANHRRDSGCLSFLPIEDSLPVMGLHGHRALLSAAVRSML